MGSVTLPDQYSERTTTIAGYAVRVSSYRLWDSFYARAEIVHNGTGGWIARAEGSTQTRAEAGVIAEAEELLTRLESEQTHAQHRSYGGHLTPSFTGRTVYPHQPSRQAGMAACTAECVVWRSPSTKETRVEKLGTVRPDCDYGRPDWNEIWGSWNAGRIHCLNLCDEHATKLGFAY